MLRDPTAADSFALCSGVAVIATRGNAR
jgi:hypothetical protein